MKSSSRTYFGKILTAARGISTTWQVRTHMRWMPVAAVLFVVFGFAQFTNAQNTIYGRSVVHLIWD